MCLPYSSSSYSCLKLPEEVESLAQVIYNYIANSQKRSLQFENVSELLEYKPKKKKNVTSITD